MTIQFVPMLHDEVRGHRKGQWKCFNVSNACQIISELLRQNRENVGGTQYGGNSERTGDSKYYFSLDLLFRQCHANDPVPRSERFNGEMPLALKLCERQVISDPGVVAPNRTDKFLLK